MNKCPHCGDYHGVRCPIIRAIEYYPDGAIKRIEYGGRSGPMIDITKPMKTRDGRSVRNVVLGSEVDEFSKGLRGEVQLSNTCWMGDSWELHGGLHRDPNKTHPGDLVNV